MSWTDLPIGEAQKLVPWDAVESRPMSTQWDGDITVWKNPASQTVVWDVSWGDSITYWVF